MKITDIRTLVVNAQMRNWVFVKVETDQLSFVAQSFHDAFCMRGEADCCVQISSVGIGNQFPENLRGHDRDMARRCLRAVRHGHHWNNFLPFVW